jgi:hypothetical protein
VALSNRALVAVNVGSTVEHKVFHHRLQEEQHGRNKHPKLAHKKQTMSSKRPFQHSWFGSVLNALVFEVSLITSDDSSTRT